jgi:hypothetical protein
MLIDIEDGADVRVIECGGGGALPGFYWFVPRKNELSKSTSSRSLASI